MNDRSLETLLAECIDVQKTLRESERRFREIFEKSVAGMSITTPDGKIIACNPAFARIFGFESVQECLAAPVVSFYKDPRDRDLRIQSLRSRKTPENFECEMRRKDGTPVHVAASASGILDERGELIECHSHVIDITERKEAEEALRASQIQLQESQKLEAVGRLAGGVAHDFNNWLTVIIGYTQLSLQEMDSEELEHNLRQIEKAAGQAALLTRQLLAFSRKQILDPVVLDLNAEVSDMFEMLRRLIGSNINLVALQAPGLGRVKADPSQLQQIIMNLVVNARDAMPQGGDLTILTANVYLDEEYAKEHPPSRPGYYVRLTIRDTGTGMDPETQAQVFEPFFTTKPPGEGTGLGLSTVYGIVKQSGGYVWVDSELGRGSSFDIFLPMVETELSVKLQNVAPALVKGGSQTILLVDDEEGVRAVIRETLKHHGYRILESRDVEEAIRICKEYAGQIHLLLTDVVMPKLCGPELADVIREMRPEIKILFISGFTNDPMVLQVRDSKVSFLQKPFTGLDLLKRLQEALDS